MEDTMYGYIVESSSLCKKNIEQSVELTEVAVNKYCEKKFDRIIIIASGSSYNGAFGAKYFMEKILKVKVDIVTSFTFNHYETIYDTNTFVFGAGQSGRSNNTNDALKKAKDNGLTAIGLTGNVESVMKNYVDTICNWGMGIEKIGFVTKGVATLTTYLLLFALEAAKRLQLINIAEHYKYMQEMLYTTDMMAEMVDVGTRWYNDNEEELTNLKRVQITGYGAGHGAALEAALKIAETTGHAATAYEQEEFLHGPSIETNDQRTVMIIDSGGEASERAKTIYESVHLLTPYVFMVTNREINDKRVCTLNHHVPEYFSSLLYCIPFQIVCAKDRDKWINPMDEKRKEMNDIIGSKSPKTGKELGL